MEFINPSFLWALLTLAIPVIIHLFYFRRFKKVYFTNVKFLQEIKEETSSRNKIKNLLVLLSRMLALAALVFAFAQPYIPQGENIKTGNSAVSVFVDNSFSMNAEADGVPLVDIAKEKARQVINAYTQEDRFQILTHDFEGRHQRLLSKEDALAIIDDVNVSPAVESLSKVISRQKQATFGQEENEISYIISDFQQSITDFKNYSDSTLELNLLPLQSVQENNISLDSVWLESPVPMLNQNNKVIVRVTNHSEEVAEGVRLSLIKDGQEKPEGTFDIAPNSSVIDTINITMLKSGWHKAEIKVSDYPVQFDDVYNISLFVPENINVLSINNNRNNRYLTALFNGLSLYKLTNQNQNKVDYGALKNYDLIILNDLSSISSGLSAELGGYINDGGNILAFPSVNANINSYNDFLNSLKANILKSLSDEAKTVSRINTDEFIFKDVYQYVGNNLKLPTSSKNYQLTNFQNRNEEYLLKYRDGSNFLLKYKRGSGHLYLCASPLDSDYNDLVLNAEVFVPMLYKMAIASDETQKISYTIGKDDIIETTNRGQGGNDIVYNISGAEEFIPGKTNLGNKVLLSINDQVKKSGFSQLNLAEQKVAELAFNYDRKESNLAVTNKDDLSNIAKDKAYINLYDDALTAELTASIGEKDKGIVLWKWCLILALLFLAIETLLLRLLPK